MLTTAISPHFGAETQRAHPLNPPKFTFKRLLPFVLPVFLLRSASTADRIAKSRYVAWDSIVIHFL